MPDIDFGFEMFSWGDAVLRVAIASAFGFCLGFDRGSKNKPVDFRVYMIVAMTSCLVAMMGQELYAHYRMHDGIMRYDLSRVIQGVLVGIGFLGAGAIVHRSDSVDVIGTATGASIWSAGAIGLMLGFGMYGLALLAFVTLAVILVLFGKLRKPLFKQEEVYDEDYGRDGE